MLELCGFGYPPSPRIYISEGLKQEVVHVPLDKEEINERIVRAVNLARGEASELRGDGPYAEKLHSQGENGTSLLNASPAKNLKSRLDRWRKNSFTELNQILETYATGRESYDGFLRRDSVQRRKLEQASRAAKDLSIVLVELEEMGWDLDHVGHNSSLRRSLTAIAVMDKRGVLSKEFPDLDQELVINLMRWWQLTTGADLSSWMGGSSSEVSSSSNFMVVLATLVNYLTDEIKPIAGRSISSIGQKNLRELFERALKLVCGFAKLPSMPTQARFRAPEKVFGGLVDPAVKGEFRFIASIAGNQSEAVNWSDREYRTESQNLDALVKAITAAARTGAVECAFFCPIAGPTVGGDFDEEPRLAATTGWSWYRNTIPSELELALPALKIVINALKNASPQVKFSVLDPNQASKPGLALYLLICETSPVDEAGTAPPAEPSS